MTVLLNRADTASARLFGEGRAYGHHGELLQGAFLSADQRRHRALVTLPWHRAGTHATFHADGASDVWVTPATHVKAKRAAELTGEWLTGRAIGGHLTLTTFSRAGHGLGSSTSDVVAAIRAVAAAHGLTLDAHTEAALAVQAEQASDSIMFSADQPLLFAHREGRVLEYLPGPLPPLAVLGVKNPHLPPVSTTAFPRARYTEQELETFGVLLAACRRAFRTNDAALLGQVATASTLLNQRHLPLPHLDALHALAEDVGALGIQVAHSGTIVGLMFALGAHDSVRHAMERVVDLGLETYRVMGIPRSLDADSA